VTRPNKPGSSLGRSRPGFVRNLEWRTCLHGLTKKVLAVNNTKSLVPRFSLHIRLGKNRRRCLNVSTQPKVESKFLTNASYLVS
jgi:hypothetical protein